MQFTKLTENTNKIVSFLAATTKKSAKVNSEAESYFVSTVTHTVTHTVSQQSLTKCLEI